MRDTLQQAKDKKKLRQSGSSALTPTVMCFPFPLRTKRQGWALYRAAKLQENLYHYSASPRICDAAIDFLQKGSTTASNDRIADDAQYRSGRFTTAKRTTSLRPIWNS